MRNFIERFPPAPTAKRVNYNKFLDMIDQYNNGMLSKEFMDNQIVFYSKINHNAPIDFKQRTTSFHRQFQPASGSISTSKGGKTPKRYTIAEDVFDYSFEIE